MIDNFNPKRRTDQQIGDIAERFRGEHPEFSAIPVDIEQIIELDLEIDIIPIPGLKQLPKKRDLDIDAFISPDFSSITVDQGIMMKVRPRYRFSLAHEIGHMVLHQEFYGKFEFGDSEEFIQVFARIPHRLWKPFEKQANEFAGRLLVPQDELARNYPLAEDFAEYRVLEEFPGMDSDFRDVYTDSIRRVTIQFLADRFDVSSSAMEVRLRKDGFIELSQKYFL